MLSFFKKTGLIWIVLLLVALFRFSSVGHSAASVVLAIQKPFMKIAEGISHASSSFTLFFKQQTDLFEENRSLKQDIEALKNTVALSRDEMREYEILTHIRRATSNEALVARVLPAPSSSVFDTLLIDKGLENGVTPSMKVYIGDVFVGFIREIFPRNSLVFLISSFNEETSLRLASLETNVLMRGEGNGMFAIDLPRDFPIIEGERVVFTAEDGLFLAGFIESLLENKSSATIRARAHIPFNPSMISFVTLEP